MNERKAVRAVLLTPEKQVLLMKIQLSKNAPKYWITPGGGIEDGEEVEACLRREITEETGLTQALIGPALWTRSISYQWNGKTTHQHETFYLVQTDRFNPNLAINPDETEEAVFQGFRWWSVEAMRQTSELFGPRHLADLLEDLIQAGPPEEPFDVSY